MRTKNLKTNKIRKKDDSLFSYYSFSAEDAKEYPVVSKILKQLTPERIKKEIEAVQKVKLPKELENWVREYKKVGGERDDFIIKWTYAGMQVYTLPSVPEKYRKSIYVVKTVSIIIDILIDDIIDRNKDKKMFKETINSCIFSNYTKNLKLKKEEVQYVSLIKKAWNFVNREIKKYPRYKEFKDIFAYDYRQFLNSIRYSYLIHKNPLLINETEYDIYFPANMQAVISITIDLMCSPRFNSKELGIMREISWYSQKMLRIGNWVSTWEREVKEDDFTSGVFAYAIESGFVNYDDLDSNNETEIIRKIKRSGAEKELLKRWEDCYFKVKKFDSKIKSVDVKEVASKLEKFLIMHLTSIGYK